MASLRADKLALKHIDPTKKRKDSQHHNVSRAKLKHMQK